MIVCFLFFCMGSCHVASACMRYRRRINDISPGLIAMFSNIHVHQLCDACCWRNASWINSFKINTGNPVPPFKIWGCKWVRDVSSSGMYQSLIYSSKLDGIRKWMTFSYTTNVRAHAGVTLQKIKASKLNHKQGLSRAFYYVLNRKNRKWKINTDQGRPGIDRLKGR